MYFHLNSLCSLQISVRISYAPGVLLHVIRTGMYPPKGCDFGTPDFEQGIHVRDVT